MKAKILITRCGDYNICRWVKCMTGVAQRLRVVNVYSRAYMTGTRLVKDRGAVWRLAFYTCRV